MPRGIPKDLTEHPVTATCWCGRVFRKRHPDQIHCSPWHRTLASYRRGNLKYLPPPPAPTPRKKPRPTPPANKEPPSPPEGF